MKGIDILNNLTRNNKLETQLITKQKDTLLDQHQLLIELPFFTYQVAEESDSLNCFAKAHFVCEDLKKTIKNVYFVRHFKIHYILVYTRQCLLKLGFIIIRNKL